MEGFAIKCLKCGYEFNLDFTVIPEGDETLELISGYEGELNGAICKCGNDSTK
jgi:hypothetical protein